MRVRRSFSDDFKMHVVESIVSGSATQAEIAREYKISPVLITRWKKDHKAGKFFENAPTQAITGFKQMMGIVFFFGDKELSPLINIFVLIVTGVVFLALAIVNISVKKKQ